MSAIPDVAGPQGPPSPDYWADTTAANIEAMQATARWLLGVVAAWWFFVPQLTVLRRFMTADPSLWLTLPATVLAAGSAGATLWAVLRVQSGSGQPIDVRHLSDTDLKYVQDWGLMTGVPTSERWRAQLAQYDETWQRARYLPHAPWPRRRFFWQPRVPPPPIPNHAEARWASDHMGRMLREERDAAVLLGWREVHARLDFAKWVVMVGAVLAGVGILVLVGPSEPSQSIPAPPSIATPAP